MSNSQTLSGIHISMMQFITITALLFYIFCAFALGYYGVFTTNYFYLILGLAGVVVNLRLISYQFEDAKEVSQR
jgi:uncharacterized membrane protein YuzA (DUF378 family)